MVFGTKKHLRLPYGHISEVYVGRGERGEVVVADLLTLGVVAVVVARGGNPGKAVVADRYFVDRLARESLFPCDLHVVFPVSGPLPATTEIWSLR